ncbi:hypothetical protein G9E11_06390 [Arthrobacter sp. IA7]|uniref:hypothetical protein n=1 Tax=Arthrobacter ipis TaxID=2716202 RepID=UPI0016897BC0|nr:hypothetical protein [Arthrobacter ipis]MBD1541883.1 hypothetical protein [Arthrobacter ipis]
MNTETTTAPSVHLAGQGTDTSIDGFELFSARRALRLLKGKLGREALLELLGDEISAGDALLRDPLDRSRGEETTGTTALLAHGITAAQFRGWLGRGFAREDVMLAGHPEHYSIHAEPGSNVNIVETLGDYVCSFFMRPYDDSVIADRGHPRQLGALEPCHLSDGAPRCDHVQERAGRCLQGLPAGPNRRAGQRVSTIPVSPQLLPRPHDWPPTVHLTGYWAGKPAPVGADAELEDNLSSRFAQ